MIWRLAPKPLELGRVHFKSTFIELLKLGFPKQELCEQIDHCFERGCPFTISVGGVTLGGSGKTQVVKYLAISLAQTLDSVFILGHGYKASYSDQPIVISSMVRMQARLYGDEAAMLAHSLKGVRIIVGGSWTDKWDLAKALGAKVIITDGGLYTSDLPRHVGLTVLSSVDRYKLLPYGHLTRPFRYWASGDQYLLLGLRTQYSDCHLDVPLDVIGHVIPKSFIHLSSQTESDDFDFWVNRKVSGICGIAKPLRFKDVLTELGMQLNQWVTVRDHSHFSTQQIDQISSNEDELWVTTEKDGIKFESPPQNLWQLVVDLRFS